MAIDFNTDDFKKNIKNIQQKKNSLINESVDENEIKNDENEIKENFTEQELQTLNSEIKKKELKKRYNFSLRPSINRTLLIESKKRGMTKSEMIEFLIESTFKKEDK